MQFTTVWERGQRPTRLQFTRELVVGLIGCYAARLFPRSI